MLMSIFYVSAVDDNCMADLVVERCNIETATVKYPLILQNDTVSLNREKLLSMEVVSPYSSPGDLWITLRGEVVESHRPAQLPRTPKQKGDTNTGE